jgi:hypothetical protein
MRTTQPHALSGEVTGVGLSSQSSGASNDDSDMEADRGSSNFLPRLDKTTKHQDRNLKYNRNPYSSIHHWQAISSTASPPPPPPPSPSPWPRSACTGPAPAGAIAMSSSCRHSKCSKPSCATTTLLPRVGAKHNVRRRTEEQGAGAHFHPLTS